MKVRLEGIGVRVGAAELLRDAELIVPSGAVAGVVGPNGSGKSTLLRTIYRSLRPHVGVVSLGGDDVWTLSARTSATRVAVLAQEPGIDVELSVLDTVLMGWTPHKGPLAADSSEDIAIAHRALARVDATHLAHRSTPSLSGGERQRILLARALTQATPVLVLDEPTNHLDMCHQLDLLALVRDLGVTVIVALHDLNLAQRYCDLVTVLSSGRVVAAGPPDVTLTPELLRDVFRLAGHRLRHPGTGHDVLALDRLP